jgi:hypothetical protein
VEEFVILYSSKISSTLLVSFASPDFTSVLHQREWALNISQGTANKSFPCSRARFAVIKVPDFSQASTTIIPFEIPAIISFLIGKLYVFAHSPRGNIERIAPPASITCSYIFLLIEG